jgi:hypothetical protein
MVADKPWFKYNSTGPKPIAYSSVTTYEPVKHSVNRMPNKIAFKTLQDKKIERINQQGEYSGDV